MAKWFIISGETERGPFVDAQLKRLALDGKLSPTMRVRREGNDRVVEAGRIQGLFPTEIGAPPSPLPPPPPPLPSTPHRSMKQLQGTDLPAAERAIGAKAFRLSIDATTHQKRYSKLASIEGKIGRAEADVGKAKGKFDKFTAKAALKALTDSRDQQYEQIGRIIRLAPSFAASRSLATELAAAQAIAEQLRQLGGKPKPHPGPAAVALTLVVGVLFAIAMTAISNSPDDPKNWGGGEERKHAAIATAKDAVANALNFPDEADFPWGGYVAIPLSRELPYWTVSGKVTGKNSFGVSMTSDWQAQVYLNTRDKWECLHLVMGGDVVLDRPIPPELQQQLVEDSRRLAEADSDVETPVQNERTLEDYSQIPPPVTAALRAGKQVWELDDPPLMDCKQSTLYVVLTSGRVTSVVYKYWVEKSSRTEEIIEWSEYRVPSTKKGSGGFTLTWSAEGVAPDTLQLTNTIESEIGRGYGITTRQITVNTDESRWTITYTHHREIRDTDLERDSLPEVTNGSARLLNQAVVE